MILQNELNPQQYEAATHVDGPLLILAGAGSGKTRVLTYRIAHLVGECGVLPYKILAITFTNKAAREMHDRTEHLLNGHIDGMWLCTFHSAAGKILRQNADRIGYNSNFTIYDENESLQVIRECQRKLNIDDKRIPAKSIKAVISKAKDEMMSPHAYAAVTKGSYDAEMYGKAYEMYQNTLKANNAMDFDDMIINVIELFKKNPDVLEHYQERFRYIMVDEYQDTNKAQNYFVSMLAKKYKNICVVGDDDQSIYSFRGADIRNILDFEKEYANCKVIKLEQNYRSTQNILDAANGVIKHNTSRKGKALWTAQEAGEKIICHCADNQNSEANFIATEIQKSVLRGEYKYSDFAILYRMNALSNTPESALVRLGIPYRIFGGFRYYERKEIKDLLAYLRVCNNPDDDVAVKRIINVPKRGIGNTTVSKIEEIADKTGMSFFNVLTCSSAYPELRKVSEKLMNFAQSLMEIMLSQDTMGIKDFVENVLNASGLINEYRAEETPEAESKIENLMEFLSVANEFEQEQISYGIAKPSFAEFLEFVALNSETDKDIAPEDRNVVTLMTIHSAKGLEFPVVFIMGMEESIFPSLKSFESGEGLDEERRLCYVAITRAMKKLYLTYTSSRMLYGRTQSNRPSEFLKEIPEDKLSMTGIKSNFEKKRSYNFDDEEPFFNNSNVFSHAKQQSQSYTIPKMSAGDIRQSMQAQSKNDGLTDVEVGMRVIHKKFGRGTVSKVLGDGPNKTAEIMFDQSGMKRLVIAYAKLEKE